MNRLPIKNESNGTVAGSAHLPISTSSVVVSTTTTRVLVSSRPPLSNKNIENAVYGHIRAVRTLGRTEILPSEIASALSIPMPAVVQALTALQSKGVKFSK